MTTRATERFVTAVVLGATAALIAVLGGRADAAVFAAPWITMLALGMARRRAESPTVTVTASTRRVIEGDEFELTTSVVGGDGSIRVTHVPSDEFGEQLRVEDVITDGRTQLSCPVEASAWGRHDLGRTRFEMTDSAGLFRTSGEVDDPAIVVVHPTPAALRDLLAPRLVRRVTGAHGSNDRGRGVEFADVRPYVSGDSVRDINWRVSARSDELWVTDRHPDRATDVVLMVDTFVESGHDVRTIVGLSIEAATGLAESHLAVSDRVGLVEFGGVVRWVVPGAGRLQLQRLTDALLSTGLFANAAQRDLTVITPRVLPPRSFIIALSPLLDDRFIDAVFLLAGRGHDVAIVECEPPSSPSSSSIPGVAQPIARRIWQLERQRTRDQLADRGVAVASWHDGIPLAPVLAELTRRRRSMARMARR